MGIIIKQSIQGSFWSYFGVVIGFITTGYLFPNYLTTETVGLLQLLLAWSVLLAQFSSLGFNGVTARLFPYFRDKNNRHNGYLFLMLMAIIVGFLLFLVVYYFTKSYLVESNIEKSLMFADYIYLLIPLTFFTLLFIQLDIFNKLLYNAVFGTFLQEFYQRILILIVTLLFVFKLFNLNQLIISYTIIVCSKGIVLFIYLLLKGEVSFKPRLKFIDTKLRKEIINVAVFSILTGLGGSIVFNIDKIFINQMLGLSATGVYTIAFFFGTLVVIPSRPLLRISGTLIAEAFKTNNINYIADIYKRSCLNQFIIGLFLFGGIWINIDSILIILGPDYADAKWVIFFIGVGYLIDMATGANAQIIAYSKYYKVSFYFILILIASVIASMFLLVPVFGITGGAIAIALSFLIINLLRYLFVYYRYRFQPFTIQFIIASIVFFLAYFLAIILPKVDLIWDLLYRSTVFAVVYLILMFGLKISDDINNTITSILLKAKKILFR